MLLILLGWMVKTRFLNILVSKTFSNSWSKRLFTKVHKNCYRICVKNNFTHVRAQSEKFANIFFGFSLLMAFLGLTFCNWIFNSLKSTVNILWRSVEKRTKENEWLSMVHLPIYFLESTSGSLHVSKQIYSFVWVSFLIASSLSQSYKFVFVLLFHLLLIILNLQAQIGNNFLF